MFLFASPFPAGRGGSWNKTGRVRGCGRRRGTGGGGGVGWGGD